MMRKIFLACSAAVLFGAASVPAHAGDYAAIAAGVNGIIAWTSNASTMEDARAAAVGMCRAAGGGSCSASTAEHNDWTFVAGYCNEMPYTAASARGVERATALLVAKGIVDGNPDCTIKKVY